MGTDDQQWFVQKGSRVQGPYSTQEVGRYLLLGRVRNTDRVSRDGELWEPVTQVPELIPEELLDLDSDLGWQRFVSARTAEDERQLATAVLEERRAEIDDMPGRLRQDWTQLNAQGDPEPLLPPPAPSRAALLPWSLLGLTLAVLAVVLYLNSATIV